MRVIPPVTITPAQLTSSTVAEPIGGEFVYSPTNPYLVGNTVISTTTHKKYTSLQGAQSNVTISIGSPCVVTWVAHGLSPGAPIVFTTTTGAFPTGITSGATVYALVTGVDTFNISATAGGTPIVTTGSQSGIHTALSSANIGHPLPVAPETQTDWWFEGGATNKWAMFDLARNTQTVGASPMTVVVAPGVRVNSLAVLGLDADTVVITATTGGVTVYTKSFDQRRRRINDGYDYFFEPFDTAKSCVMFDVTPITNLVITITIAKAGGGTVSCGSCVFGTSAYIGSVAATAESDSMNYSTIDRDIYGVATLIPRRTVPKTKQSLRVDNSRLGKLLDIRTALNAVPAVWCGLDDTLSDVFEPLLILGIYKQFTINMDAPSQSTLSLELEEI